MTGRPIGSRGFTLIELPVVLALVFILFMVSTLAYSVALRLYREEGRQIPLSMANANMEKVLRPVLRSATDAKVLPPGAEGDILAGSFSRNRDDQKMMPDGALPFFTFCLDAAGLLLYWEANLQCD